MPPAVQIGRNACQYGLSKDEDASCVLATFKDAGSVLSSLTERIKSSLYPFAAYSGVTKVTQELKLLKEGKANLFGIAQAPMKDAS